MKKYILTLLLFLPILNCRKQIPLSLAGSETMHESILLLSSEFMKQNSSYIVDVRGGGSRLGIEALQAGIVDIAMVSRDLKEDEKMTLDKDNNLEEITVAYDGAAIVVHRSNSLVEIDLETVSKIFRGEINNWKELGGEDLPIVRIRRNQNSGTALFFKERVIQMKDLGPNYYNSELDYYRDSVVVEDQNQIVSQVFQTPGAISYLGMGAANQAIDRVKLLKYKRKKEDDSVTPSIKNLMNRRYRLARGLYLVYKNNDKKSVNDFISFVTGEVGQRLILKTGYLRSSLPEVEVKAVE